MPRSADLLETAGDHAQHRLPRAAGEVAVRVGAADERVERLRVPLVHRNRSDNLLAQHVERVRWRVDRLDSPVEHPPRDGSRFDQILAVGCVDAPFARLPDEVAGTANALKALRHAAGRLKLHDEVDVPDVDAEFERAGRNQRGQLALLERLFHLAARLAGRAPVVRLDRPLHAKSEYAPVAHDPAGCQRFRGAGLNFLRALGRDLRVEPVGRSFGKPPIVGEHQRGAVAHDIAEHLRHDRRPDRVAREIAEVLHRHDDFQVEGLLVAGVDDRDRARLTLRVLSCQKPRGFFERANGGRKADALDRVSGEVFESLQAQRSMSRPRGLVRIR